MEPFKIYYADGATHTGDPAASPGFGVICILQRLLGRCHVVSGAPYYMVTRDSKSWLPAYENDVIDSLVHRPGEIVAFCVGQIVSRMRFTEIFEQAKRDRDAEDLG